jgi:hypothetical protein
VNDRDNTLILPEGREAAWHIDGTIHVLMPSMEKVVNLQGETHTIRIPRLLLSYGEDVRLRHGEHEGFQFANIAENGGICFGSNPHPADPYEAWHFYWDGQLTIDLVGDHNVGGCERKLCRVHESVVTSDGERRFPNCGHNHQCRDGFCVCKPPCACPRNSTKHAHSYWADHRRGTRPGARFRRDERCHCCMRTCGHGRVTCTCPAANHVCRCTNGQCQCTGTDKACDPVPQSCGCGAVDRWRANCLNEDNWRNYVGGHTPWAAIIPNQALGLMWPSAKLLFDAGVTIPGDSVVPSTHARAVRSRIRIKAPTPLPAWWNQSVAMSYNGMVLTILKLLPGGFYQCTGNVIVNEECVQDENAGFAFRVGDEVVPTTWGHKTFAVGRALKIGGCQFFDGRPAYWFAVDNDDRLGRTDLVCESNVRAATPEDPRGLPDQYEGWRFRPGQVVIMNPVPAGTFELPVFYQHWVGRAATIAAIGPMYGDKRYTLKESWCGNQWVHDAWLSAAPEGTVALDPRTNYIPTGTIVQIKRLSVEPLWWDDWMEHNVDRNFPIADYSTGRDGTRRYRFHGVYLSVGVPEPALIPVGGAPRNEPRTIQRPSCGDNGCLVCPRRERENPNYRPPDVASEEVQSESAF